MSDSEEVEARSSKSIWLTAALPVLFCLYVLSIGQVGALLKSAGFRSNDTTMDAVQTFYAPVIWLHDNTPLKKPLEWYGELWG